MDFILEPLRDLPLWSVFVITIFFAYMFGAVPFSMIVGKTFFGVNLQKEGSGNLGATNTFRVLGAKAGIGILLLDMTKGAIPIFVARWIASAVDLSPELHPWLLIGVALAAVIGHTASPYIKFRGGKGAATSAGVMLALVPIVFLISVVIFFSLLGITRYVSVATIGCAVTFPLWTALVYQVIPQDWQTWPLTLFAFVVGMMVTVLHRANISRLRAGTESKFSWKDRGKRNAEQIDASAAEQAGEAPAGNNG